MEKESVVAAIKKFILPELDAIKENQARQDIRLDGIEKRLSDINTHLIDQSRRIDELRSELTARIAETKSDLGKRISENTIRIDGINNRIDQLTFQMAKIAQEMERIKRDKAITADIVLRLRKVENKVANL